jgi:hypothetical protein
VFAPVTTKYRILDMPFVIKSALVDTVVFVLPVTVMLPLREFEKIHVNTPPVGTRPNTLSVPMDDPVGKTKEFTVLPREMSPLLRAATVMVPAFVLNVVGVTFSVGT